MLQEENESMLEKVQYFLLGFSQQSKFIFLFHLAIVNYILEFDIQLRLEEERYKEAEARVKELEKQVIAFFFFFMLSEVYFPICRTSLLWVLLHG